MARPGWGLVVIIIILVAILAGAGVYLARRGSNNPPLEILLTPSPATTVEVRINGEVNDPGVYFIPGDTRLDQLPQISGGLKDGAVPGCIEINVPASSPAVLFESQKVNLNTAPEWMLEALPAVGPGIAQNIIEYRNEQPFQRVSQLLQVEGIGSTTYEKLKDLVTVE